MSVLEKKKNDTSVKNHHKVETIDLQSHSEWTVYEKFAFRVAFIFYVQLCLPIENFVEWVTRISQIKLFDINYRDLYDIAGYRPDYLKIASDSGKWGIASYVTWAIALVIGLVGATLWTWIVRLRKTERKEYKTLYYWLRVIVRYRIAVGIIAFGYVKLFPTQMPYPSQAVLNTLLGDMQEQKIYWYSVGVTIWYQVFLGLVEIVGGALLFFRRTTALGAALIAVVLFNIAFANHSYDGGVHVYAAYFVLLSLFVLIYDFPKIWNLLVNEKDVTPVVYEPVYTKKWQRYLKYGAKYAIVIVYLPFFFYIRTANYFFEKDPIKKEPTEPGLTDAKGLYNVTEFRINNKTIPYSPLDSIRWQTATFEKWSTLTFKVNRKVKIDSGNGGPAKKDFDKNFELSGIAGGQRFFYYTADTVHHTLSLQDKNKPFGEGANATKEQRAKAKELQKKGLKTYTWHYERPTAERIILYGLDEHKDSIYVVLDRVNKKYPLNEGRREAAIF